MLILAILFYTAGFCLLYGASPKTAFPRVPLFEWTRTHSTKARIFGGAALLLGFLTMVRHYGFGTGLSFGLLLVMLLFGPAILLIPLYASRGR